MKRYAAFLIAGLALTPMVVGAQSAEPPALVPPPTFSQTASDADAAFVDAMLVEARTRLALADLAGRNAGRSDTRALAARETALWSDIQERLLAIAAVQGLRTPDTSDAAGQGAIDRLSGLSTGGFDDAYASVVAQRNQRAMQLIEAERRSSNPALVALATEHLHGF